MERFDEARALEYLKGALPEADGMVLSESDMRRVVRHALEMRELTDWGPSIPEDIFLPFVLFPRVNNEDPVFYHAELRDRLWPRIRGMGMEAAVLEVNKWCFEQANYRASDARTANALTVARRGCGRCGEETVLLVCALRACGLPARQIYAPLWSHCDDNHAWVEAWVDGSWHYLGACEPELSLDSGWFTAAASKAMLIHTRAYGRMPADEYCERREGNAFVINRTAAYARTRLLRLRFCEAGQPKPGLSVAFQLVNMAAYRPICIKQTDRDGVASLLTGLGTLRVCATDGTRTLELDVDVAAQAEWEVDFGAAAIPAEVESAFAQRPPRESRMQLVEHDPARVRTHAAYLNSVERQRAAQAPARVGGKNSGVIASFLLDARFDAADSRALIGSLREKDLADVTMEVLEDAMRAALPYRDRMPYPVWVESVLCPRAADEMLRPLRGWIRENLPAFEDAAAVWRELSARMTLCELEPSTLMPDLRAVLSHWRGSRRALDVAFTAVCRANGIPARLDLVSGEKLVWADGAYRPLLTDEGRAALRLVNPAGRARMGDVDFSVSVFANGFWQPLALSGIALEETLSLPMRSGWVRVMTSARDIDGSCEGTIRTVHLKAGEVASIAMRWPQLNTADRLLNAALPPLWLETEGGRIELPAASAGQNAIVACIAPGQEPTQHLLNELLDLKAALARERIAVWLIQEGRACGVDDRLEAVLDQLKDVHLAYGCDAAALLEWRLLLDARELRLPLVVALGRGGEGRVAFVNYRVGSVAALIDALLSAEGRHTDHE